MKTLPIIYVNSPHMENSTIAAQIEKLGYLPTDELIKTVQEVHLRSIPDSTIKRAFTQLEKARKAAKKAPAASTPPAPAAASA